VSTEHWHKRVIGHLFLVWLACNLKRHPCASCASPKATQSHPSGPASIEQRAAHGEQLSIVAVVVRRRPEPSQYREPCLCHCGVLVRGQQRVTSNPLTSLFPLLAPTKHLSSSPACLFACPFRTPALLWSSAVWMTHASGKRNNVGSLPHGYPEPLSASAYRGAPHLVDSIIVHDQDAHENYGCV
jgi:hypothetical protein